MRKIFGLLTLLTANLLAAQSTDFPLDHPAYQLVEMDDIRQNRGFNTTVKPFSRSQVFSSFGSLTPYMSLELRDYSNDSLRSRKEVFGTFYEYPADFYYYKDENVTLHANPVMHLGYGRSNDDLGSNYINTRGVEIRGKIDDKVAFYTFLTENQARLPAYVNTIRDSTLVIPFEGFWKQYNETDVDYFRAQGYIDFGLTQSISAQLGFGKHFVGNGIRSLILSDYANNYPYLRINTTTKIFDYTNIFAELIPGVQGGTFGLSGTGGFGKKYMAFHHLNIKIKPNLHIGLFESVMYGDSTGGLKFEYLNPVIFYRAIEQQNGSEDNALIGLDFKWNIKQRLSLYGQLVIDEMIVSEVFAGNGWWGNKQGFQLGAKYLEPFGIENLILQGEINRVRPYMYAHENGFRSYSHYNLALAHPFGANFTEYLGRFNYRLSDQWNFEGMLLLASYGNDRGNINFGRDILKDYTVRIPNGNGGNQDFGNEHLQGNKTDLNMIAFRASYMWKHNIFVDLDAIYRSEKETDGQMDTSTAILGLGVRWNVAPKRFWF